ncbi:MAG: hypothetical protein ACJAUL_002015 [Paraglaciecola sp.]
MTIKLTTTKQTDNVRDSSVVASIKNLWQRIEKNQKKINNQKKKIAQLYQEFQTQVLPYEQEMCTQVQCLITTLLPFVSRKSLNERHREALLDWINQELNFIETNPFAMDVDIDNLRDTLQQQLLILAQRNPFEENAENLQQLALMLEEMFGDKLHLNEQELSEIARDPGKLQDYIECMHSQAEEESKFVDQDSDFHGEYAEHDEAFEHNDQTGHSKREQLTLDKLFKSSELNKIYKRLATKIHPDKEIDDELKAEKQVLMQQLSAARKVNDVFTILLMYQTHCDETDISFDDTTLLAIQKLLGERARTLEREHSQLSTPSTPEGMVWKQFSGRSKKATANNFAEFIAERQEITDNSHAMAHNITNLEILKEYLNERLDSVVPFDDDIDFLNQLFG